MYLAKKADAIKQEYIVIGAIAAIVLALLWVGYRMLMPTVKELGVMGTKIKKGQTIAPDRESYRSEYDNLEAQIDSLRQQIEQKKEKLFWKKDIGLFLERLTHIAEQLAVDFISIRPSLSPKAIKSDDEETVLMFQNPINITMKTGHKELIDFFRRIEESEKFFRIDSIDIQADQKDIFKRKVTMVLSIFSAD